jgi:hypothetical protein
MTVETLIKRLENIKKNGHGNRLVQFRNCGHKGTLSQVDYIMVEDDKENYPIILCEEWY